MTYLYAGLGIAMFTAIVAMFEMAGSLTDQQMFSKPANDPYFDPLASWQYHDKRFLKMVNAMDGSWGSGVALCQKIVEQMSIGNPYEDLKDYRAGVAVASPHPRLRGACDFNKGEHRVLIVSAPAGSIKSHLMYSCLLRGGAQCPFELPRS